MHWVIDMAVLLPDILVALILLGLIAYCMWGADNRD